MTATFTQGHRVTERRNLSNHSVVKLLMFEATQVFVMVDCVRKMTAKKSCKYGEYESFEHLLFLVCLGFFACLFACFLLLFCCCFVLFCCFQHPSYA